MATLDLASIDATSARWLQLAALIIQKKRDESSQMAAGYLRAFRSIELGTAELFTPTLAPPAVVEQLETSLLVTGPYRVRKLLARNVDPLVALERGNASSAAAAMRHALNGGRDTILATVQSDAKATGWRRVTSGNPCSFCLMLAGRGGVYKSQGTASFQAHDSCHCYPEPAYGFQ